ncbi:MAG: 1-deoxy-D-xylulose-5-phosphate reductoisomerase [Rickettsiales bacterium]|nr:1-deoxy-D-xylulose-5-phosphate reductoisomerase [Rickettsiales bacterium]|tara:strand:+ start:29988 stop:31145 length:1158 start_codon:yes stop_codon:yes gene_type:complete
MKKKITIYGSTGSVGNSTLDIYEKHNDKFELVGLTVNKNYEKLLEQVKKYKPKVVAIKNESAYQKFKKENNDLDLIILGGDQCLIDILDFRPDLIIASIVGSAGLLPVIKAAELGINIGLANKESLVCSGEILKSIVRVNNVKLLPIDSEHNAIFQVFENSNKNEIEKIILTASGGPFIGLKRHELKCIKPEEAISHPNWNMGRKISVDSATLMNKGLEFIEAYYLFDMKINQIDVLIHPQSIVHSCVQYSDGSVLAQLGTPDMRTPIAYAMGYPERISAPIKKLNLADISDLSFSKPDHDTFPALNLAINALKVGKNAPTILNAANEIAVEAFLKKSIPFLSITKIVDLTLNKANICELESVDEIISEDIKARQIALDFLSKLT